MTKLAPNAQLALDTILHKPTKGVPSAWLNIMEHSCIEKIAGASAGDYEKKPEKTYLDMEKSAGICMIDQYIPRNPLEMGAGGYEKGAHTATTGVKDIVLDGMPIRSPEDVVEHLEKIIIPRLKSWVAGFDADRRVREMIAEERRVQEEFGPSILKVPYAVSEFPALRYGWYGYENYFMAYALYPEVMEKTFAAEADWASLHNAAVARAYKEGGLPPMLRLDHDMADSRSTLVDIKTLDKMWFPQFVRSIDPLIKAGICCIWHCDGNLMEMVPRLLDCGLRGFQGFQYEDGMDYEKICGMRARDGGPLLIEAGVSVTVTLPRGTPEDVKKELKWLADKGPKTGLFLCASSSIAPKTPLKNIETLIEGLKYYSVHGRS